MQTPTTADLCTTIQVLDKLAERINAHAAQSVRQIPPSSVSGQLAGQIGVNAMEQNNQVKEITRLLQTWKIELEQRRRQNVFHHV